MNITLLEMILIIAAMISFAFGGFLFFAISVFGTSQRKERGI
jgi:hypothetical protein